VHIYNTSNRSDNIRNFGFVRNKERHSYVEEQNKIPRIDPVGLRHYSDAMDKTGMHVNSRDVGCTTPIRVGLIRVATHAGDETRIRQDGAAAVHEGG
jgi:hypothetical protein